MLRKLFVPLAVLCLVLAGAASVQAAKANQAPTDVTIDDCAAKRAPVAFPHGKHTGVTACDTCHHTQKGLTAKSADEVPMPSRPTWMGELGMFRPSDVCGSGPGTSRCGLWPRSGRPHWAGRRA